MIFLIRNFLLSSTMMFTLLLLINQFSYADVLDEIVAVVNDDVILASEFSRGIDLYKKGNKLINSSCKTDKIFTKQVREKILASLIDERIIEQEAKHFGITCTLEDIDAAIEHIKKINNCTDLNKFLEYDGVSMNDLRQALKKQILKNKIIDKNIYPKIIITDENIKEYYNNNFYLYDGILKYHIYNVLIKITRYDNYSDLIFLLDKIFRISKEIESGLDFDDVSKIYSSTENINMSYVGMFSEDELSEHMKESMVDLTVGNNSKIMKTKTGLNFFHIKNITKTEPKSVKMVKSEIYQILLPEEVKNEFDRWLSLVKKRSSIKIFKNNL